MIGILSYGSLRNDLGEIAEYVSNIHDDVAMPFSVEFLRKSRLRNNAPTLTISSVDVKTETDLKGSIIELNSVTLIKAKDLLWRRETRQKDNIRHYYSDDMKTDIEIGHIENYMGFELIYAKPKPNIVMPTPSLLAELALNSMSPELLRRDLDGVSYLIDVKNRGMKTPMLDDYESELLRITNKKTLNEIKICMGSKQ